MNCTYVWKKIFDEPYGVSKKEVEERKRNVCEWISFGYKEGVLSRNVVGNLMLRMRKDYKDGDNWEYWDFIINSESFEEFIGNIPEYTKIRARFPSRDKLPVDPMSLPLSNEKMYGKGINSRVREE